MRLGVGSCYIAAYLLYVFVVFAFFFIFSLKISTYIDESRTKDFKVPIVEIFDEELLVVLMLNMDSLNVVA